MYYPAVYSYFNNNNCFHEKCFNCWQTNEKQCYPFQETSNRLKWRKKTDIESEIMLQDDCRNMHIATKNFYITIIGYYSVVDYCFRIPMIINT